MDREKHVLQADIPFRLKITEEKDFKKLMKKAYPDFEGTRTFKNLKISKFLTDF